MIWGYPFFWKPPFRHLETMSFQSGAPFWSTSSPSRICLQGLTRAHAGHRGHWPYLLLGTVRSPWNSHLLEEFHSEDLFIFNSLDPLDPTHYRMWLNKKCCHYPSLSPFFILFSLFNWLQRSRNGMFTPLKWFILCCLPGRRGRLSAKPCLVEALDPWDFQDPKEVL